MSEFIFFIVLYSQYLVFPHIRPTVLFADEFSENITFFFERIYSWSLFVRKIRDGKLQYIYSFADTLFTQE